MNLRIYCSAWLVGLCAVAILLGPRNPLESFAGRRLVWQLNQPGESPQ